MSTSERLSALASRFADRISGLLNATVTDDAQLRTRVTIARGREWFHRVQLRAALRRDPETAIEGLQDAGWSLPLQGKRVPPAGADETLPTGATRMDLDH